MANDFIYSERGHREAAKVLDQLGLTDDERAYAIRQAAIVLQPIAMSYKIEQASGKALRTLVVRLAVLRAVIYVSNELKALNDHLDRYKFAHQSSDQADAMMVENDLTPAEVDFVEELSNGACEGSEREIFSRSNRGEQAVRYIAVYGALAAALVHAEDWEQYGWLRTD